MALRVVGLTSPLGAEGLTGGIAACGQGSAQGRRTSLLSQSGCEDLVRQAAEPLILWGHNERQGSPQELDRIGPERIGAPLAPPSTAGNAGLYKCDVAD